MGNFGTEMLALIDSRIDAARSPVLKMGTVQDRAGDSARATVSFDGSAGSGIPVKCAESVVVATGDRVAMGKVEGDWIILGVYTPRTWADILTGTVLASSSTTTSATFVDMPTSPHVSLTKNRDATTFQIIVAPSMWATAAPTVVELGVNITFPDGTTSDIALYHRDLNAASDHRDMIGGATITGTTLPAGPYSIVGRWRRSSGTGTLTMDVNDSVTLWAREVINT